MTSLVSLPNFQCGNRREYFGDCHLLSQLPRLLSEIAGQRATRPHVLTRLLQLVAICFRTIKSWSGFADDLWWRSSKCSANNDILKFFLLLKY